MTSTSSSDKTKVRAEIPTFNGTNYQEWADAIRGFMRYGGVWFLIEGYGSTTGNVQPGTARPTLVPPAGNNLGNATEVAAWDQANDKALGIIQLYTAANLKHHINSKQTAAEAWKELKDTYEKPGAVGAFVAFQKMFNAHLSDQSALAPQIDSIIEHAARVNNAGITVSEQMTALVIVNCLPKSYQGLAGTILATEKDLKDLKPSSIRPKILEEEQRRVANRTQIARVSKPPVHRKWCEKCGKETNHSTEQHWDKGKPKQGSSGSSNNSNNKGNKGNKGGKGKKKDKGKGKATVNTVQIVELPDVTTSESESISVSLYKAGTKDTRGWKPSRWLMDSGCTSHVTPERTDFIEYHQFTVPGTARTAGKKNLIKIVGHGKVIIRQEHSRRSLILSEVLHIPEASDRFFAPRTALEKGCKIVMEGSQIECLEYGQVGGPPLFIAQYNQEERLYWLEANIMIPGRTGQDIWHEFILKAKPGHKLANQVSNSDYDLWHKRFGHPGKKAIEELPGNVKGVPKEIKAPAVAPPCDGCEFGKSKRGAFPPSETRAEYPCELIHLDLVEYPNFSVDNFKYTMTTLDDHSSFGLAWYLKNKSDALKCFKNYVSWAETQSGRKVKAVRSDRGGEFTGKDFDDFLSEKGIERQLSVARTPQQNGRAERWQQTIQNKAEAMRHHAGLSNGFWKLAVETAVHIYNRQPLRRHNWKAPITVWDGTIPDVSYFRVFGCKAYVHTHKDARSNKLQAKAKVMIFVGYESGTKGYRFWDISTRSIVVARDASFDENSFPRRITGPQEPEPVDAEPPSTPEPSQDPGMRNPDPDDLFPDGFDPFDHPGIPPMNDDHGQDDDDDDLYYDPPPKQPQQRQDYPPPQQFDYPDEPRFCMGPPGPSRETRREDLPPPRADRRRSGQDLHDRREARRWVDEHGFNPAPPPAEPIPNAPRPRRENAGQRRVPDNSYDGSPTDNWRRQEQEINRDRREDARRPRAPPGQPYQKPSQRNPTPMETDPASLPPRPVSPDRDQPRNRNSDDMDDEEDLTIRKAKSIIAENPSYFRRDKISATRWIYYDIKHATSSEPQTYREAMSRPDAKQWELAMQEEIKSQHDNQTWYLVKRPNNRRIVKCKWVYAIKADGRYKARLVAKGFTQVEGIDFQETFSPVARYEAIRFLLAHAALEDWELEAMDIKTAFLYGELDEEIYMEQPEGFVKRGQENQVCRLKKAIYGLKQASRTWNEKLHTTLLEQGFKRTRSDAGVYVYSHDQAEVILIVYVDDLLHMGHSLPEIKRMKKMLADKFQMRDLGAATNFLGMRITRDRKKKLLTIDQQTYTEGIIQRFKLQDSKTRWTPLPEGIHLEKPAPEYVADATLRTNFQQMIGSLIYLMIGTRPDISWAVSRLSQYMQQPTNEHVEAAKNIFRYLKTTVNSKIRYLGGGKSGLIGYSDADWGENRDNRRSTTGFVFLMADGSVTWTSHMQKTVARSSTEAEYMALSEACSEIAWLTSLQKEIGFVPTGPTPLVSDNQGGIFLAVNPAHDRRLKHVDIRYHFIREYVESKRVKISYTSTDEMIADILTKPLGRSKFERFRQGLGIDIGNVQSSGSVRI